MMMGKMCGIHKVCWILVFVGAVNWGLIGAFQVNIVSMIFGSWPIVERIIYILVGASALMMLGGEKCCMGKAAGAAPAASANPPMGGQRMS